MNVFNYNDFIKEQYSFKSHDLNFLPFGNWNNKKIPMTDEELALDHNFMIKAVKEYDEIFGTELYQKYGEDYTSLINDPSIHHITSGDVIKRLVELSYQPKWYSSFEIQFDSSNMINQIILDQIVNKYQGKQPNWEFLNKYLHRELKPTQRNKEFLYQVFRKYGSQFDQELLKSVFEIKNKKFKYDIINVENVDSMSTTIEIAWWKSVKWALSHFKDYFELKDLSGKIGEKLISLLSEKSFQLIDDWVNTKVNQFLNELKN